MVLTIGNWVLIGIIAILGIVFTCIAWSWGSKGGVVAIIIITFILVIGLIIGLSWWHTNTASGIRAMKDFNSDVGNGINREITITAEDGRDIFHYEGKIDIETSHENSENYILFESEEGLRYIIYYGVQDTVLIVEKAG